MNTSSTTTRRQVAKGLAWSVPAVAVGNAAPAMAASLPPRLNVAGRVTWNKSWYSEYVDNYQSFKVFSTASSSSTTPGAGYCVANTTSGMTITNFTVTYYLPSSNLSFYAGPGGSGGWSPLSRNTSLSSKYSNGTTYYAYTTTYASLPARNGTTCAPAFQFESQDNVYNTGYFFVDNAVTVNGSRITGNYGPISMS